ncbi:hypothetical protein JTE90_021475 [Oedothorax gibbosus]|uniref:Uncharacterized protein n=1 Tax=Oedothorax gibbosus TaxID=931172 RepID=A0AAV6VW56_9ARAC|nr:hypothetical protein JTE90_021475 [Oedothorax gibbosus]
MVSGSTSKSISGPALGPAGLGRDPSITKSRLGKNGKDSSRSGSGSVPDPDVDECWKMEKKNSEEDLTEYLVNIETFDIEVDLLWV